MKICGPLCEKIGQNVIELTAIGTVGRILKISIKILHSKGCLEAFCERVRTLCLKIAGHIIKDGRLFRFFQSVYS